MKRFQTVALLTILVLSSAATASRAVEYEVVTRGPNGAGVLVKSDRIPLASHPQPKTEPHAFPEIVTRGPGGAGHIKGIRELPRTATAIAVPEVIYRGPNGGGQIR